MLQPVSPNKLTEDTSVSAVLQPVSPNKQNVTLCIMGVSVWLALCLGVVLRRDIYGSAQNRTVVVEHGVRHCSYWAIGLLANIIEATSVDDNALWIFQNEVRFHIHDFTYRKAKSTGTPYFVCVSSSNRKWLRSSYHWCGGCVTFCHNTIT
jgi:hypothetical protein